MKKTKTFFYDKDKFDFINFWNRNPSEDEYNIFMTGSTLRPYHIYYVVKYPNGGIPQIKIRYRKHRK